MVRKNKRTPRPFWQQYLSILSIDSLLVIFFAFLLGDMMQVSNLYFWSSVILMVVAIIPVFSEAGGNIRTAGKAFSSGKKLAPLIQAQENRYQQGARVTYLFGLAAITTFILSILLS